MNYVRLFLEFLAKNHCLNRYFYNLETELKSEYGSEYAWRIYFLLSGNPKCYIVDAFLFLKTKEGEDYWAELNSNWCAYLKNNPDNER